MLLVSVRIDLVSDCMRQIVSCFAVAVVVVRIADIDCSFAVAFVEPGHILVDYSRHIAAAVDSHCID